MEGDDNMFLQYFIQYSEAVDNLATPSGIEENPSGDLEDLQTFIN
jgi:hypothetical protein